MNNNKELSKLGFDFSIFWSNYADLQDIVQTNFNETDKAYFNVLSNTIMYGNFEKHHRTDNNKLSTFSESFKVDISEIFPLISLKKTNYRAAIDEQCWFMSGSNNINDLPARSQFVWKDWADENGSLKDAYGKQLINDDVNQLVYLENELERNISSTRLVLDYWNAKTASLNNWALPPCHYTSVIKNYEKEDKIELNLQLLMRSSDLFIGLPFNLVQYGFLMHAISDWYNQRNYTKNSGKMLLPATLAVTLTDAHIYSNQVNAINKMFENILNNNIAVAQPKLRNSNSNVWLNSLQEAKSDDYFIINYKSLPFVKCPVVV